MEQRESSTKKIIEILKDIQSRKDIEQLILLKKREELTLHLLKQRIRKRQKHVIIRATGVAAAAIAVFSLLIHTYYSGNQNNPLSSHIESKYLRIEADTLTEIQLILSNGIRINLDNANHQLLSDNGIVVGGVDEQRLRYKHSNEKSDSVLYNTLIVPKGKRHRLELSDGSVVTLNSDSKITYPTQFTNTIRRVDLNGEAFFEVAKDTYRAFVVNSKEVEVRVLGTKFNMRSYGDENQQCVTLASGSVVVDMDNGISQELHPGRMLTYNNTTKKSDVREVVVSDVIAWMDGQLVFIHEDINEIIRKIARYYNVTIVSEITEPMTVYYRTAKVDNAEMVLKYLEMAGEITYIKHSETNFTVRKKLNKVKP